MIRGSGPNGNQSQIYAVEAGSQKGKRQTAAGAMPEGRGSQRLGECRGERLHIGAEWRGASLDGLRDERGDPRDRPGLQTITGQEQQPQLQMRRKQWHG